MIFVHGLAESETFWWWPDIYSCPGAPRADRELRSYGDRLADEGLSAVYLRYSSGRG